MKSFFKKEAGLSTGVERAVAREAGKREWARGFYASVTQDGLPLFTVSRQVRRAQEREAAQVVARAEAKRALKDRTKGRGALRGKAKRRAADEAVSVKGGRGRLTRRGVVGLKSVWGV